MVFSHYNSSEICHSNKKIFSHEVLTYSTEAMKRHTKTGDPNQDTSFKGHPECGFCTSRFYGDDELYDHCRKMHEQCFLCQRLGVRNRYFVNYASLETHFGAEHFPCKEASCQEQKFVVFESDLDLQGHLLKEHGDSRAKHKGRQIQVDFNYVSSGSSSNPTTRRAAEEGKRSRKERYQTQSSVEDSMESISLDEDSGSSRRRAPAGFGQLTAPPTQTAPESSSFNSFASRPQVNRPDTSFPSFPESLPEVLLNPAQADVLVNGGSELILYIQKLIGYGPDTMAQLKILVWSFKNGSIPAERLLRDFHSLALAFNARKKPEQLLTEMGGVWTRISACLPEEATDSQLQKALEKRSKKKGLSIAEFDALRKGEPKKSAMLRAWNDHKVKVDFI